VLHKLLRSPCLEGIKKLLERHAPRSRDIPEDVGLRFPRMIVYLNGDRSRLAIASRYTRPKE
jgi:hypothetical protein